MHSRRWSHSPHMHAFEVIRYTILLLAARAVAGLISDHSLVPYPTKELPPSKQCPSQLLTQFLHSWFELMPTSVVHDDIWQSLCACFLHYTEAVENTIKFNLSFAYDWLNCLRAVETVPSHWWVFWGLYGLFATDKNLSKCNYCASETIVASFNLHSCKSQLLQEW